MNTPTENIVLIGMPGAGKSTLGVVLAKMLGMDFVDCDLVIQRQHGKTLQEIIDDEGTGGFIAAEEQALAGLDAECSIIATGGSAVYSDVAMQHLATMGPIVYLEISYESLVTRLGDLHERGVVLRNGTSMSLRELYDEREPLYRSYANLTVNVDDQTIPVAARKVADAISDRA